MDGALATVIPGFAENGITFVVLGTVAFSLVVGVLFLVSGGNDSLYDRIGEGGISREEDHGGPGGDGGPLDAPGARAEQEEEIRQMLGARNERLLRRGELPVDIDAEVARLLAPGASPRGHDAGLEEEVRQLVLARNERRLRQGMSELDVDSEVARTLAELDP